MLPLIKGESPKNPKWIRTLLRHQSSARTLKKGVFNLGDYDKLVITREDKDLGAYFEELKLKLKNEILRDFHNCKKIKRQYREIAWEIYREEGIDPMRDWQMKEKRK